MNNQTPNEPSLVDPSNNEMLCPMCRRFSNILVPVASWGTIVSERSKLPSARQWLASDGSTSFVFDMSGVDAGADDNDDNDDGGLDEFCSSHGLTSPDSVLLAQLTTLCVANRGGKWSEGRTLENSVANMVALGRFFFLQYLLCAPI